MAQEKKRQQLRTAQDLTDALEDIYNRQNNGELDAKSADALNTTIKSAMFLRVRLPMDAYKTFVMAQIKKIQIPEGLKRALPISFEN